MILSLIYAYEIIFYLQAILIINPAPEAALSFLPFPEYIEM
jgi:hypothetical protein